MKLGVPVARRSLPGEDLYARHPVDLRVRLDGGILRHRLDDIEQLPLVFVDALDLDVEQSVPGEHRELEPVLDHLGEPDHHFWRA